MSNPMEGFKMDPKLAETMKRIKAEHPAPFDEILEQTIATPRKQEKKRHIDPDAMAHDLYHRMRQTDP